MTDGPVLNLAAVYKKLGDVEKSRDYQSQARKLIEKEDHYNFVCLESIADNIEQAFVFLKTTAQKEGFDLEWAWEDPDLEWICDDPRFEQIVGPKPT